MSPHLISRVTILGTGLIGGSFALALRKYTTEMHISGWDRPDVVREAQKCGAVDEFFPGENGPLFLGGHPMAGKELPGIAHAAAELFSENTYALIAKSFEPVAAGLQTHSFPIPKETDPARDPRISAFVKILEKIGARPLWLGAQQHDYAVGLASHLPQLAAVALAGFLYDRLDENGLPITLAGPGLR